MFKIRDEHMEAQAKAVRDHFEDRLVELLCTEFPEAREESLPDLRLVVHEQVDKAFSYGLQAEQDVGIYVTAAWLLGREFDTDFPAAHDILTSELMSPGDKSFKLSQWTERLFVALEEEG